MMDKYDENIEYLRSEPEEIYNAWNLTDSHVGGDLFQFVGPEGQTGRAGANCGCLTQIRNRSDFVAYGRDGEPDPALTAEIRADERIPFDEREIRLEHLPAFAEWQRRLDAEVRS